MSFWFVHSIGCNSAIITIIIIYHLWRPDEQFSLYYSVLARNGSKKQDNLDDNFLAINEDIMETVSNTV